MNRKPDALYSPAFFAMAFANFCNLVSFGGFFLFPLFVSQKGGNAGDVGVVMGAFSLASVLCRPWISQMIDRMGRKGSFTLGAATMTCMPLTYPFFQGSLEAIFIPMLLVRVIHGVGFAICITAAFTYVADIVPPHRLNEGVGIFGVSGLAGSAVGPVIAEWAIGTSGFQLLFWLSAAIPFLGLIAHLPLRETHVHSTRLVTQSFFRVLIMPRILLVAVLSFLFGVGIASSNSFVSPFAGECNVRFISIYYVAYSVAAILTRLGGSRLGDLHGEVKVIPYALIATGSGLLVLVFLGGETVLMGAGLLGGCGHGLLYPALTSLALRGVEPHIRGKVTGAFTGSIDAGVFLGSILLGYIGEFAGFRVLFLTAGLSVWAAVLIFFHQTWKKPELLASATPPRSS